MPLLTLTIPTYEMKSLGNQYLKQSFDMLARQTFKDFDIVISDHSKDTLIRDLCDEYKETLDIKYYKNPENIGNSSANLNNAIKKATGKIIKILFQDDFLFDERSLELIVSAFDLEKDTWLVTACEHSKDGKTFYRPFYPRYNDRIHLGNNTLSSPSALAIRNDSPLLFDENLIWLMDVDYYKRLHDAFGPPKVFDEICVVNRVGTHQVSNTLANQAVREIELIYVKDKFRKRKEPKLRLDNVTLVAVSSVKIPETIRALEHTMIDIDFARVVLVSHQKPERLNPNITFIKCSKISSLDEYSRFMLYDLAHQIDTDHALVIQHDGFVVRPYKWDPAFLGYDYIGAPWPPKTHFTKDGSEVRVGNGGFSLRSKKLMGIFNTLNLPFEDNGAGSLNEDGMICNYYRKDLEQAGISFAPVAVASHFSLEDKKGDPNIKPFGFHRNRKYMPLLDRLTYWI